MSFEEIRRQVLDFVGSSPRPYRPGDVIQVAEPIPMTYDFETTAYTPTSWVQSYQLTQADINSVYGGTISFNSWETQQPTRISWSDSTADPFNINLVALPEVKVVPKVGRYKQFKLTKDGMSYAK